MEQARSDPPAGLPRPGRLSVAGQLWLIEIALLTLLCGAYAGSAHPSTPSGWFFLLGGRLSCAASLSLLPGLATLGAAALLRAPRALAVSSGVLWSLVLFLVYVDTRIYGIFRYHFNGLVWNVLTTPGSDEAVHFSRGEVVGVLLALALLALVQYAAFLVLWRRAVRRAQLGLPAPRLARPALVWKLLLVPDMLLVAGLYAWADLRRDPQVMAFSRVYPVYPRLTINRFAERFLGVDLRARPKVDMPAEGILLDYPRAELALDPSAPRPNVVVIVIDSLRADMVDPEVMPRVSALAREGRSFRDHLSSGNATRFGVFGLLYGLHGSYWDAVTNEHRSPVLVDVLLARGYQLRVLTSASMDFPEFRSCAWVRVEDSVEDRLPSDRPGGRDDGVALRFEQWLDERDAASPFFAFLLLDAPHQRYYFPEECALFRPYMDDVSYAALGPDASPDVRTQLFNRYRNAVHYADQTTGRVLDALAAHGLAQETLVAVTGDHGEEFFENGVWGHTSNFTQAQVHVPLVLAGPLVQPGVEERPTSHLDLSVTLVELLGADPAMRQQWSLGENLFSPPPTRARVVSGWDTLGVYTGDVILDVPMAGYGGSEIAVYDGRWQRRFDDEEILAREGKVLGTLALECRRFLR